MASTRVKSWQFDHAICLGGVTTDAYLQGATMSKSKLVLVTGATGQQGGAVVQELLARGHQVRALTRNIASPAANRLRQQGVEIAIGDFTDHASLLRAARGVDAVYAMSTPFEQGAQQEVAQGIAMTDAA